MRAWNDLTKEEKDHFKWSLRQRAFEALEYGLERNMETPALAHPIGEAAQEERAREYALNWYLLQSTCIERLKELFEEYGLELNTDLISNIACGIEDYVGGAE